MFLESSVLYDETVPFLWFYLILAIDGVQLTITGDWAAGPSITYKWIYINIATGATAEENNQALVDALNASSDWTSNRMTDVLVPGTSLLKDVAAIDTAIKAKTDTLPSVPASQADVDNVGQSIIDEINLVKEKTDQLTFTGDEVNAKSSFDLQEIVDGVWDAPMADHATSDSTGATLIEAAAGGGGGSTAERTDLEGTVSDSGELEGTLEDSESLDGTLNDDDKLG